MKAGSMPGGDAVCHGHHVWDEDECLRCGLLDLTYHDNPESADSVQGDAKLRGNSGDADATESQRAKSGEEEQSNG